MMTFLSAFLFAGYISGYGDGFSLVLSIVTLAIGMHHANREAQAKQDSKE